MDPLSGWHAKGRDLGNEDHCSLVSPPWLVFKGKLKGKQPFQEQWITSGWHFSRFLHFKGPTPSWKSTAIPLLHARPRPTRGTRAMRRPSRRGVLDWGGHGVDRVIQVSFSWEGPLFALSRFLGFGHGFGHFQLTGHGHA